MAAQHAPALAQLIADGMPIHPAGRALGMTKGQTASTWALIKRRMGKQAR